MSWAGGSFYSKCVGNHCRVLCMTFWHFEKWLWLSYGEQIVGWQEKKQKDKWGMSETPGRIWGSWNGTVAMEMDIMDESDHGLQAELMD